MDIWDKIGAMTPTRDAAVATSGGDPDVEKRAGRLRWKAPPLQRPVPKGMQDLRGRKFGEMTIIGLLAADEADGKNRLPVWVARCVCGDYEARRHKKLRRGGHDTDCCEDCTRTRAMRHRASGPATAAKRAKDGARLDRIAEGEREA